MYLFQETLTLHDKSLMSLAIKVGVCPLLWVAPHIGSESVSLLFSQPNTHCSAHSEIVKMASHPGREAAPGAAGTHSVCKVLGAAGTDN